MKAVILSLIGLLLVAQPVWADEVTNVRNLVAEKIVVVVDTIKDTSLDKKARNQKIIDTVAPFFSFDQMAKLSLGKKYWLELNSQQKNEFIDVFVDYLQRFFIGSLEQYTNEKVEVAEAKQVGKRIHVVIHLLSGGETMELVFKFYRARTDWLVYDIDILGVSVIHSKNSEIDDKMKREGYDGLIKYFRESAG